MSLPPPDFSSGSGGEGLSGMMPSISPSFTGGAAGPSSAENENTFLGGGVYNTLASSFIVGGEGNTATGGTAGEGFNPLWIVGGLALWFLLRKK